MESIIVQTRQECLKLKIEDIYYIMSHPSRPHCIQIVTDDSNYNFFQSLQIIEDQYSGYFVRCHRNCLVNLAKIKSINVKERVIVLGERGQYQVAFSRRRHQKILQEWINQGGV
ncbi:TPA: LytR/AlgR family response regulator transcription factor [Streptococcus pyogenes]|uniref:LytR/AlgR family response regulator transcription factor n=1 Tax=Streptococcus pyogenes TaxID=1314 RepID=UPI0010DB95C5|nr:LytTR family DNA-binding domain-containing protein [Streptococcus pyogenes]VGT90900.1 regulatory protein, single domain response regulator [Streptococcus pyogenes]VGV97848.1 regulatory protein, single domain response regulator [Streptococcus pyogenes]VGW89022.1 regulatory protein, single domain response regulator [Streptococcus pyogenes]VGZ97720.1 regulatory protein, single domain response regulator [Streptococcus pyogenes]VHA98336.1 regulatory protein, single domain response regulator [Str